MMVAKVSPTPFGYGFGVAILRGIHVEEGAMFNRLSAHAPAGARAEFQGDGRGRRSGAEPSTLSRIRRFALEYHDAESVNPQYTGDDLERFLVTQGFETQRFRSRRRKNHGLIRAERAR